MTLLADLEAFVQDHRPHGGMTGDATEPAWNGYRLTVACGCGVVFERWVTPEEADTDTISWLEQANSRVMQSRRPDSSTSRWN